MKTLLLLVNLLMTTLIFGQTKDSLTNKITTYTLFEDGIYPNYLLREKLSFYPNPTKDTLTIAYGTKDYEVLTRVEIYNTSGKLIGKISNIYESTIKLSIVRLSAGTYMFKICIRDFKSEIDECDFIKILKK